MGLNMELFSKDKSEALWQLMYTSVYAFEKDFVNEYLRYLKLDVVAQNTVDEDNNTPLQRIIHTYCSAVNGNVYRELNKNLPEFRDDISMVIDVSKELNPDGKVSPRAGDILNIIHFAVVTEFLDEKKIAEMNKVQEMYIYRKMHQLENGTYDFEFFENSEVKRV